MKRDSNKIASSDKKGSSLQAKKKMKTENFFLRWDIIEAKLGKDETKQLKDNSIDVVDLCGKGISIEMVEHLAEALKANTSLKEIYLSSNWHIGDKGVKYLAEALKVNNSLQKIELNDFGITTEGIRYLAEALKVNTSFITHNWIWTVSILLMLKNVTIMIKHPPKRLMQRSHQRNL